MKKIILSLAFLFIIHCTFNPLWLNNCYGQWVQKSNGMGTNKTVWSFAVSGNNIFAGTNTGVYLSTNNGEFWSQTSLNNKSVWSLAVSGNNIYAGTNGVYLSTNIGLSWTQIGMSNIDVWALSINGSNIFAATGIGVSISTNNGMNWTQTSLYNKYISSLIITGNDVFAGDWNDCNVFRSTDNGSNWAQIFLGGSTTNPVLCLAVNGNNFFAGTDNGGVLRSTNNGLNWAWTSLINISVLALTTNGNYIFAGAAIWSLSYGGVFLSSDNGDSWILKKQGMSSSSVSSLATTSQYIFAGTDSSVWRRSLSEIIGIENISTEIPSGFSLSQNYPNPFNPVTKIKFTVANGFPIKTFPINTGQVGNDKGGVFVTLKVFDVLGREVETLVNEQLQPGIYEVEWNASQFSSGVYFYQFRAGDFNAVMKMVLIR
jgi:hypothetical protein